MSDVEDRTVHLQRCLDRLRDGDLAAREELLSKACERLSRLAKKMLRQERRVGRWEDSDDVLQNALMRLHRALEEVHPSSVRDFFRLAAAQIRRELIDLARHYYGAEGQGAHHASVAHLPGAPEAPPEHGGSTYEPRKLAMWTEFHRQINQLPAETQEVFDLLWYQGLTQMEVANLLEVSERTIQRRWQLARDQLARVLRGGSIE
jgi:RNA polymerase sigma-70 factor (ECF subfamily)